MKYLFNSLTTFSFWKYAVFSKEAIAKLFAVVGTLYLLLELMDFFSIYTRDQYSKFAIMPIFGFALVYVIFTRRPVSKIRYKVPNKDFSFEVKIGDLFSEPSDVVISTNTTFDTDIASGLISPESLQGQLAIRVFGGATMEIDRQLKAGLGGVEFIERKDKAGNTREYPIGTVAKVTVPGKIYYFMAMSKLNDHGTASATIRDVEDALARLWEFVKEQGELRPLAIPLTGTGRGRIDIPRKKMIERIAQSFADSSRHKSFSNRLTIVVRPEDAENFDINLFEVRDYLVRSLHL